MWDYWRIQDSLKDDHLVSTHSFPILEFILYWTETNVDLI